MHRVLSIQEILLNIFGHFSPTLLDENFDRADLAALARTCQTFKGPALDVLWEKLFDVSLLARCLPEACQFDGSCYSFSRPLSEAEWNTLRGYTRRVRSIHKSSRSTEEKIVLPPAPFTDPLFPNLQSLFWGALKTLPVEHIAVPSLISLSLTLSPSFMEIFQPQMEILDALGERCPNIRRFGVLSARSAPLDEAISRQLRRWSNLQYLDCLDVILSMDAILHLPALYTLKRLWFTLNADLGDRTTYPGSVFVFSNLVQLSVCSTSLKSITTLFSLIGLPKIEYLGVFITDYPPRSTVQAFWTTIQSTCSSGALAHLLFSSILSNNFQSLTGLDSDDQRLTCLTLDDLLPYKDFGNLLKIVINLPWSVSLTDADLLDLVSTSPHLEEVDINNFWGWKMEGEGGITLTGLVQLLRQCPSLCSASFVLDLRTFTHIPRGLDVSFPPRKTPQGTLSLNCLESHIMPEFDLEYQSVFEALKLRVWTSRPHPDALEDAWA